MMYSSNVVVVNRAMVLMAAAATAIIKRSMPALKFIAGGAALVAAGAVIERALTGEGGAIVLSVCLLAGALVALPGIIRLLPR
jgi:hypothetical protein